MAKTLGAIVTGKRTQLTIAITGKPPFSEWGINNAAVERAENFPVGTPTCDILDVH